MNDAVCGIAANFPETAPPPPLLLGRLRRPGASGGRITVLTIDAVTQHCESASIAKSASRQVGGLFRYCIDFQSDEKATLTGESSRVLIHAYPAQAATLRRSIPAAIRRSLFFWAYAIELDWPLDHALLCAAAAVESNVTPKQAPAIAI